MDMSKLFGKFFTGINYWCSESGINMWSEFNPDAVEKDFILLKNAGITHLRVFPLWPVFQPLKALYSHSGAYEYAFGEEPLPDTPAGRAGVSEEACRNFEKFCDLAEKYDLKLIVGLITGHMSFRIYSPPAFDGKELLSDPTVIKWQVRFVKYFVTRFKDQNSIVGWDLGNEINGMPGFEGKPFDTSYVWCTTIADAIKVCDPDKPVISGLDNSEVERGYSSLKTIGEMCDVHTTHPYNIFQTQSAPLTTMKPILDLAIRCAMGNDIGKVPTFVQEFGAIGYMNCSRKTEADFYRACLMASLAHGCYGAMWWCAFDQGHFDYAPYRWNNIGSDYGFFDKDLNPKPVALENLNFQKLLSALPDGNLPPHTVDATILVPRDDGGMDIDILRSAYLLAKQANFDVKFNYALDEIEDSPLYILPSVSRYKTITKKRFDELMEKVYNGAVLYISADTGLMRKIPEITGVDIAYREDVSSTKTMMMDGLELPISTTYFLKPESYRAKVIGADENGEGVFFEHKYGDGYVYFITMPLEKHLAKEKGAFFKENRPPYDAIYRKLAKNAKIQRIADSDHPYVRLTEHKIDEKSSYIFAINYNNTESDAKITIPDGYDVETVFGNDIVDGVLHLRENDGALFKATKK